MRLAIPIRTLRTDAPGSPSVLVLTHQKVLVQSSPIARCAASGRGRAYNRFCALCANDITDSFPGGAQGSHHQRVEPGTPSQAPMSQVWLGLAPRRRDEGSIDAILLMFTTIGRNMQIAVLSNGRLDPWINWSTLGPPLLRPLATMTGVLLSPPRLIWSERREWARLVHAVRRADGVFWMQGSARPETPLFALSMAAGITPRSAFVVDAWKPSLKKIAHAARIQRLDPCFVAFREGAQALSLLQPKGNFEWLPFGIDAGTFAATKGERDIFAFSMGRRHEPLHQQLLAYCASRGLEYRYRRDGEFLTASALGQIAGRSKYFVVTPPDLDNTERTGGFSPLVMRYLEGLSAGARLLGVLPKSGEYERLLPREAILEVSADGMDLESKLDADLDCTEGWQAVEVARDHVRRYHSWDHRAEQIRDRLVSGRPIDLPSPPLLGTW